LIEIRTEDFISTCKTSIWPVTRTRRPCH